MEHASIASFARLSLELMAVEAPAELVACAHRAALDEVEHARVCFSIASELGHESRGPSALSLEGLTIERDLAQIARRAALEGCVGETVAALALSRAASLCEDEALSERLAKMAEDELSHATLAWKIVAWACARGGERVRRAIADGFEITPYEAPTFDAEEALAWNALGRLTRADLDDVTQSAHALVRCPLMSI